MELVYAAAVAAATATAAAAATIAPIGIAVAALTTFATATTCELHKRLPLPHWCLHRAHVFAARTQLPERLDRTVR